MELCGEKDDWGRGGEKHVNEFKKLKRGHIFNI